MFEKFINQPELEWLACAAAQAIGSTDIIQVNPDLENFKLERFKDLRAQPKASEGYQFQVMLIGSSKTNIFIKGQNPVLDRLVLILPNYIGKSWSEIKQIKLAE